MLVNLIFKKEKINNIKNKGRNNHKYTKESQI